MYILCVCGRQRHAGKEGLIGAIYFWESVQGPKKFEKHSYHHGHESLASLPQHSDAIKSENRECVIKCFPTWQQGAYTRVHRGVKKKRKVVNDSQVDLV